MFRKIHVKKDKDIVTKQPCVDVFYRIVEDIGGLQLLDMFKNGNYLISNIGIFSDDEYGDINGLYENGSSLSGAYENNVDKIYFDIKNLNARVALYPNDKMIIIEFYNQIEAPNIELEDIIGKNKKS